MHGVTESLPCHLSGAFLSGKELGQVQVVECLKSGCQETVICYRTTLGSECSCHSPCRKGVWQLVGCGKHARGEHEGEKSHKSHPVSDSVDA